MDEGDRYWFVLLRDPTTDAEVGRWIYDTQPYRPALRVTESPTFSDRIPVPPGTYKVTVGIVSSVPLVDPDGVPEGDPFANSILTTFYETVT